MGGASANLFGDDKREGQMNEREEEERERKREITDGDGFDIISYYLQKPYSHLQGKSITKCSGFPHISK